MLKYLLFALSLGLVLIVGFALVQLDKENKCQYRSEILYKQVLIKDENISKSNFTKFFNSIDNQIPFYIKEKVKEKCFNNSELNLACAVYFLTKEYDLHYIKENDDSLETIKEFLQKRGGDCEDYSFFFFKLLYDFYNEGIKGIKVLTESKGSKAELYREGNTIYYTPDATYINLKAPEKYGVVCFLLNESYGHCVLFIDNNLVEPQNGLLVGQMLNNNKVIYKNEEKNIYIIMTPYKIYMKKWGFWLSSN